MLSDRLKLIMSLTTSNQSALFRSRVITLWLWIDVFWLAKIHHMTSNIQHFDWMLVFLLWISIRDWLLESRIIMIIGIAYIIQSTLNPPFLELIHGSSFGPKSSPIPTTMIPSYQLRTCSVTRFGKFSSL